RAVPRLPVSGRGLPPELHRRAGGAGGARRRAALGQHAPMDHGELRMSTATTATDLSSRIRWTIVGLLSASITINLLDRQILSVLAAELRNAFHWSNAQYGYI